MCGYIKYYIYNILSSTHNMFKTCARMIIHFPIPISTQTSVSLVIGF